MILEQNRCCQRIESKGGTPVGSLLVFFALTYVVTWACFIAAVAISRQAVPMSALLVNARGTLLLLGTFAPSLVALAIVAWREATTAVKSLLRRVLYWRVGAKWYLLAVSYMAAIKLGVALIHRILVGSWPTFGDERPIVILVAIVVSTPFQSGEEIGWRGYAPPHGGAHWIFRRQCAARSDLGVVASPAFLSSGSG